MPAYTPTERLYFGDSFLRQFSAPLLAMTVWKGKNAAVLDATAFYPEGGGQPGDRGILGGVAVIDVQEEDDVIYHLLAEPLTSPPGTMLEGTIDWQRRFDFMQQHTGQHTLSGAFFRLLDAPTLSWRLSAEAVSIDIGRTGLHDDQLAEVLLLANNVLWDDVPVTAAFYTAEEAENLALRKGFDRTGPIRVVSIGDFDRIGCGGTHVRSAGQVGAIAIRRWETRGQMTRVEFACGERAMRDAFQHTLIMNQTGVALSSRIDEIPSAVQRLQNQLEEARHETQQVRKLVIEYEARELLAQGETIPDGIVICGRFDQRDAPSLRALATRLAEGGAIALLGGVQAGRAQLVFAAPKESSHDLNTILRQVLPRINGKGGGQRTQAQGAGDHVDGLEDALQEARAALTQA